MKNPGRRLGALIFLHAVAVPAAAGESTVYTYDGLGRLVAVTVSGGPNDGQQTSIGFDPADNRTNYSLGGVPAAKFSIADVTVNEGTNATLVVSRMGSSAGTATVDYTTSNISALAPGDYTAASGTLTFADGETSKSFSIATIGDGANEGIETFGVALSSPSAGSGISFGDAVVTIIDVPKLTIANTTIVEGGTATLTVTRSGFLTAAFNVGYATANGSATSPADFGATSGTLSFLSGEVSKTISVPTVDDALYEGPEAFTVVLSAPTGGAVIDNGVGTVSVSDNDPAPGFAIANGSATEGGTIIMTVTKSGATDKSLSVNYATSNGSAIAPGDYGSASGVLTFLPTDMSKSISISTVDDSIYEANETFSVQLSGASGGATISSPTGIGTINDNDVMPTLSVSNASVVEGNTASVTVTKSGATNLNITASYAASGGTAPASDYNAVSGVLTLLPEETSKVIQIPTVNNSRINIGQRTFNVGLSSLAGATIGSSPGVVTIQDDEPVPTFTLGVPVAKDEGTPVSFSVHMSPLLGYDTPITINYATSSGTATSGVDFTPTSGTATFTSPAWQVSIPVPTIQDSDVEPDETIIFTISSVSFGTIAGSSQAVGTIKNDDYPPSIDPIANADNAGTSFARCDDFTINPVLNDTSPSGKYPLTLVSVATGTGYERTISGNTVSFFIKSGGAKSVQYVVANSIGQQSTGVITWSASPGPVCQ